MSDAADKLARTRLAIIEHVYRKEMRRERQAFASEQQKSAEQQKAERRQASGQRQAPGERGAQGPREKPAAAGSAGGRRFRRVRSAARSYWRHHPARMGLQMATPLLSQYARRHPLAYLGIAAAAGALLTIARPWRLISVTGILVGLVKSPQLAGLLMSAMSDVDDDEEDAAA
ncbi:hypothetical protein GCM10027034_16270 [Ramlibacter solisilvae]|uniref:hypothetical protein n=1 Tax=Ramlibacter tataouinensis TaxID=94132 RepID=UPI00077760AE|nr:hypothetical protein [Ramlibacter tataouinensis]